MSQYIIAPAFPMEKEKMLTNEKEFIEVTRNEFCDIMLRLDPDDLIVKKFENTFCVSETMEYVFVRHEEDVSIIEKYNLDCTPRIINWYKLYHIGRCLNLYGFTSKYQLYKFIYNVVKELK